jgi:Gly-Xaa carboxypeptidase
MAEMGYLDVRVSVSTPGGHSSIPPAHTSIGMLSSMLVSFEANPYPVHLARRSPVYNTVQCIGAHAPNLPESFKRDIMRMDESNRALKRVEEVVFQDPMLWSLSGTTQAIDLVGGGVKSNALPENAWAVLNHRIGTSSSVKEVMEHDTNILKPLAHRFNLSLTAFGTRITSDEPQSTYGTLELSDPWDIAREPAPVTSVSGAPYKLLSGTIKAVFSAHRSKSDEEGQIIHVAPGLLPGGTDTRSFWDLSDHIFRYNHDNGIDGTFLAGMHNVNENIEVDAFLEQIRFFSTLVLNSDEAEM